MTLWSIWPAVTNGLAIVKLKIWRDGKVQDLDYKLPRRFFENLDGPAQ